MRVLSYRGLLSRYCKGSSTCGEVLRARRFPAMLFSVDLRLLLLQLERDDALRRLLRQIRLQLHYLLIDFDSSAGLCLRFILESAQNAFESSFVALAAA